MQEAGGAQCRLRADTAGSRGGVPAGSPPPLTHIRQHHGGGDTGPMHATPRQLNVNTETHITRGGPDSHPLAPGPVPQSPLTQVPGTVQSDLPPPATAHGLFGLEAPETAPLPRGGVLCPPGVFPAGRTLRRQDCPWGPLPAPHPPRDQEPSSLQGPELAADTPGMPTASGRTGVRAGGAGTAQGASGSLVSRHLGLVPPSRPQPPAQDRRKPSAGARPPRLGGAAPRCGNAPGRAVSLGACVWHGRTCVLSPHGSSPHTQWAWQLHWHQRLEVVGFPPQMSPQATSPPQAPRPRGSGEPPGARQSWLQVCWPRAPCPRVLGASSAAPPGSVFGTE